MILFLGAGDLKASSNIGSHLHELLHRALAPAKLKWNKRSTLYEHTLSVKSKILL